MNTHLAKVKNQALLKPSSDFSKKSDLPSSAPECLLCKSPTQPSLTCFDRRFGIMGKWEYYFCSECFSYSINPVPILAELQEWYENFYLATCSVNVSKNDFWSNFKQSLDGQECLHKLLQPGATLDIGCGTGNLLATAKNMGHEVWGQEFNPQMVELAQSRGLKVTNLPITDSYFPQEYFDNVILSQLIEHVENPRQFLQDILPLLSPGGQIIISTPNPHSLFTKLFRDGWAGWHPPFHLCIPSYQALVNLADELGLTCTRVTTNTPTWLLKMDCISYFYGKEGEMNLKLNEGISKIQHLSLLPLLPILRIIDFLKLGDNTVVVLQRSSE